MEQSLEQAQSAVNQAREAMQSLHAITRAVATINDMNTQIASAAEEQATVSEEVNKTVSSISQISEQATAAANALAKRASGMQQLISQFRIQGNTH